MIIHDNRQRLVPMVFADLPSLPPSFHEMIFILVSNQSARIFLGRAID